MTASRYRLYVAAGTHPGLKREQNEDAVLAYSRPPEMGEAMGLLIVADGMGGHQAGEVASQIAVETIFNALKYFLTQPEADETRPLKPRPEILPPVGEDTTRRLSSTPSPANRPASHLRNRLAAAVRDANAAIYQYGADHIDEAGNLGCTLTCALIRENMVAIAHVGDSRAYRLRGGNILQLTSDHSYVGEMVRAGQLAPEEVFSHPRRNVITRALGRLRNFEPDLWTGALRPGDRLLLCSDGLWEMIHDPAEIAYHLGEPSDLELAVQRLIDAANAAGGEDNIGVAVCELTAAN